jgi:hypothetical protein
MTRRLKGMKKFASVIAFILLFCVSAFGFAAWSATLTLEGKVSGMAAEYDVKWVKGDLKSATVKGFEWADTSAGADNSLKVSSDGLAITIPDFTLGYPGAGAKFQLYVINSGDVDAKVKSAELLTAGSGGTYTATLPEGLLYDAADLVDTVLSPGETCMFEMYVKWDDTADVPEIEATGLKLVLTYDNSGDFDTFTDTTLTYTADVTPTP